MVKPLTFKGDKKPKKRKRQDNSDDGPRNSNQELVASSSTAAEASSTAEDQHWVSADIPGDLTGPVIIVLPSTPPTCLASDAHGKVFASEVENLIEGNPSTAEPHDVRQVWVATKIAGTDGVNFKGHHGRYVSVRYMPFHSVGVQLFDVLSVTCHQISEL
jgi:protein FRG1